MNYFNLCIVFTNDKKHSNGKQSFFIIIIMHIYKEKIRLKQTTQKNNQRLNNIDLNSQYPLEYFDRSKTKERNKYISNEIPISTFIVFTTEIARCGIRKPKIGIH